MTSNPKHEPLFDVDPRTGISIELFYADRTLETFGKCGAGWFYWSRRRGFAPDGPATGPFATSYAAYRHALGTDLGTQHDIPLDMTIKSEVSDDLLAEREGEVSRIPILSDIRGLPQLLWPSLGELYHLTVPNPVYLENRTS